MESKDAIRMLRETADGVNDYNHMRTDGNLGMAIMAAAISEHAQATNRLADSVEGLKKTIQGALCING